MAIIPGTLLVFIIAYCLIFHVCSCTCLYNNLCSCVRRTCCCNNDPTTGWQWRARTATSLTYRSSWKLALSRSWISLLTLLYAPLVQQTFTIWRTMALPTGGRRISDDYSIIAFAAQHWSMIVISSLAVVCYVIGIPVLLLWLGSRTWSNNNAHDGKNVAAAAAWSQRASVLGSVIESYKPQFWWWESLVVCPFKLFTVLLTLWAPSTIAIWGYNTDRHCQFT
jgi:hypothetical protein